MATEKTTMTAPAKWVSKRVQEQKTKEESVERREWKDGRSGGRSERLYGGRSGRGPPPPPRDPIPDVIDGVNPNFALTEDAEILRCATSHVSGMCSLKEAIRQVGDMSMDDLMSHHAVCTSPTVCSKCTVYKARFARITDESLHCIRVIDTCDGPFFKPYACTRGEHDLCTVSRVETKKVAFNVGSKVARLMGDVVASVSNFANGSQITGGWHTHYAGSRWHCCDMFVKVTSYYP